MRIFARGRRRVPHDFGRAVTTLPAPELILSVEKSLGTFRISTSTRDGFARTLADWVTGEVSKQEASAYLGDCIDSLPSQLSAFETFRLSRLTGALGLFSPSLALEKIGRARARRWSDLSITARTPVKRLRSHFFDALPGSFREDFDKFELKLAHKILPGGSLATLRGYAQALLGLQIPPEFAKSSITDKWARDLSNKKILVVGPGILESTALDHSQFDFVVRTLGNGGIDWNSPADPANGRADLLYLNAENEDHFLTIINGDKRLRSQVRWVNIKRGATENSSYNIRRVDSGGELFHRGHANLVPLICADLAQIPGTSVHVIGASFFASATAYRSSPGKTNLLSISANRFDRSTVISSHNPFQNLAIVRNLFNAGIVSGDITFEEICNLTEEEYSSRLDSIYG